MFGYHYLIWSDVSHCALPASQLLQSPNRFGIEIENYTSLYSTDVVKGSKDFRFGLLFSLAGAFPHLSRARCEP